MQAAGEAIADDAKEVANDVANAVEIGVDQAGDARAGKIVDDATED